MKITFRRGEKLKKITTNQLECLKILFEKSLILVVITSLTLITLFATLALPRANASENYRFDTIGNKGAQFQLSDTPNKVYSCLNKDSYLPELRIAHFRNDVYE